MTLKTWRNTQKRNHFLFGSFLIVNIIINK